MYKIKVRATEDIYNHSKTRIVARKGRIGEIYEDQAGVIGNAVHVDVLWEGNKTRNSTPGWLLEEKLDK